jgi:hypothetical protein
MGCCMRCLLQQHSSCGSVSASNKTVSCNKLDVQAIKKPLVWGLGIITPGNLIQASQYNEKRQ